jgi:hypothetical protein
MGRRGLTVLVVVVLLLGGVFVVADRIAAGVAQDRIAARLGEHRPFTSAPDVTIHGFPFLTQALSGKYDDITVSGSGATVAVDNGATLSNVAFHADLRGVHVAAGDAIGGGVSRLPVDHLTGYVVVPYSQVAELADNRVSISADGTDLVVTGSVQVPVLGTVRATGRGTLHVSGRTVTVELKTATVDGKSVPANLVQSVIDALTPHLRLPTLPYQLQIDRVRPGSGGLRIDGHADDVVLLTTTG